MKNIITQILIILTANAAIVAAPVEIIFDYRYDDGFFDAPERREALELVANWLESRLDDDWPSIETDGDDANDLWYSITNPGTGASATVPIGVRGHPHNTLVIFVGGYRNSPMIGSEYPKPLGMAADGEARGSVPGIALRNSPDMYVPTCGSIAFNANVRWYFDSDPTTDESLNGEMVQVGGQLHNDFFKTAAHEILHVLGLGTKRHKELIRSFDRKSRVYELMPHTMAEAGTAIFHDGAHFFYQESTKSRAWTGDGWLEDVAPIMVPSGGSRYPTELDYAVLRDLGMDIIPIDEPHIQVYSKPSGYAAWVSALGVTGGDALPEADPDGDGVANLASYALGLEPGAGLMAISSSGGEIHMQLPEQIPDDVTYLVECSVDLVNWDEGAVKRGKEEWTGPIASNLIQTVGHGGVMVITVPVALDRLEKYGCSYSRIRFQLD